MSAAATLEVRVESATDIASQVRQLRLIRGDDLPLPGFTPGAHIDLHLGPGLVRQYSLCGELDDLSGYTIAVKREPSSRGGSQAVHERLAPGVSLRISLPRNRFSLDVGAPHVLLLAAGIGVTPLLCMARALDRTRRPYTLHHFGRSREQAAYADLLQSPRFAPHCHIHLGLARAQLASTLRRVLANPVAQGHAYICGPAGFMDLVRQLAAESGWPAGQVHVEHFGAEAAAAGEPIELRLARSQRTVRVPADVSIADALRQAGLAVETSCEQGVCGTCIAPVLDGTPEHKDLFLTTEERASGRSMALCVSRARSPYLVLDI